MKHLGVIIHLSLIAFFSTTDAFWDLVWEDDFGGSELNESNWNYDEGCDGWGNDELQCYTARRKENIRVENGHLTIHVHPESYDSRNYTSGRIRCKKSWTYGKFEARARLPKGKHLWPELWMMPVLNLYGEWAASGEIDIMEYRGQNTNQIEGTIHYGGEYPNNAYSGSGDMDLKKDFSDDWHLFSIEWDVNEIRWYCDNEQYHKESLRRNMWSGKGKNPYWKEGQPFDQAFAWIVNVAVGGSYFPIKDYGSLTVEEAKQWFKPTMDLDFLRVYQWK